MTDPVYVALGGLGLDSSSPSERCSFLLQESTCISFEKRENWPSANMATVFVGVVRVARLLGRSWGNSGEGYLHSLEEAL